ncbi:MAG: mandelate racemase/muconate lactonizing enzyme family protein [Albidovulum sp.]|nr:mandelate racemase/muconate lactonizing enzyme family protein [Albidovulum sp.]
MKIESVEFYYLAMPEVALIADGSQDALVVRIDAGGLTGWGECEASPLVSVAAFIAPMSHAACQPVSASVIGRDLHAPDDIRAMAAAVAYNSMDLLQASHTWSGIEMALWDLLGKARSEPAWKLLGYDRAYPKTPYASVLFGETPEITLARARDIVCQGFRAAKFGWAPFGETLDGDIAQLDAAREGLGPDGVLLVDAGQVFVEDVEAAAARLEAMNRNRVTWFEEPFAGHALAAYRALGQRAQGGKVGLAGGEAAHNRHMAEHLIEYGGVQFIQIDCGRIGGLGPAKQIAAHAVSKGVVYVNHTFTSNLALSASLQPFAGLEVHEICEYPTGLSTLARDLTRRRIAPDENGMINVPDAPGLGVEICEDALTRYHVPIEIMVRNETLFAS